MLKRQLRKVLKSKQCFHYGNSINLNEEKKDNTQQQVPLVSNLTEEEKDAHKYFTELTTDYHKKKGVIKYWSKRPKQQKIDFDLL